MPDVHRSTEDVIQMTPNFFGNDEVKQENFEDTRDDRSTSSDSQDDVRTEYFIKPNPDVDNAMPIFKEDDHVQSSNTEDIISLAVVKAEPSDVTGTDDAAVEQDDADLYHSALGLHTECDIPLDIVKEEPDDVDTVFEEDDHIQSSDTEDIISLAVVKAEPSDVTGNDAAVEQDDAAVEQDDAAVEQDDADLYHSSLGLHTECDIPLDIVKEEPGDVDTGAPRLAAQKYRNDTLSSNLKRTDQIMDKVEEPKTETGRDIEDSLSNKLTPLLCDTCQKSFKCKNDLIIHTRIHTGEKPHECNVCKKCFKRKSHLNDHMRIHTDDKPFKCNGCTKCFNHRGHLKVHMRIHTGEKPYECNVCYKRFKQRWLLNVHMRIHTGEKPYKCNLCEKRFYDKDHLRSHIRVHKGEKPYECNVCKKCFARKYHLECHTRTHTGWKY